MNSKIGLVVMVGSALIGCVKQQQAARGHGERDAAAPPLPAHQAVVVDTSGPAPAPVKAPPRPPLVPLATGKVFRLDGLDDAVAPLQITAPLKFRPKIVRKMARTKDSNPTARLIGPGVELIVGRPQAGLASLTANQEMILKVDPTATFVRTDETEDGFVLIDIDEIGTDGTRKYKTTVSRPQLQVQCGAAAPLESLSDAERVASICLTLRALASRTGN